MPSIVIFLAKLLTLAQSMFTQVQWFYLVAAVGVTLAHAFDCSSHGSAKDIAAGHDFTGKVVFMTGGDSGIGYETALALARINATVIIANRNVESGQVAVANITNITGNAKVESMQVDLSSFASVQQLASGLLAKYDKLDVVIFDAGVSTPHGLTKDGFEFVLQVNYISHFLLEQLILPALRCSSAGKLIQITSGEAYDPCQDWGANCTDLESLARIVKTPTKISNYRLSKFMMLENARELSMREAASGSAVRGYSLEPGFVDTPLVRRTTSPETIKRYCSVPDCAAGWKDNHTCETPCPMPQTAGACTPTYVAVTRFSSDMDGAVFEQCNDIKPPPYALENQKGLYGMSLSWTEALSMNVVV